MTDATPASCETLEALRQFVGPTSNPDPGVIAFLFLYLSLLPDCPPISVNLTSRVPIGAGLGSSAAMSVCFASGLIIFSTNMEVKAEAEVIDLNENKDSHVEDNEEVDLSVEVKQMICDWAFLSEKIMHGTPSGNISYPFTI